MLKTIRKRLFTLMLVVCITIGIVPCNIVYAAYQADSTSGLGINYNSSLTVYNDSNLTSKKGTIYVEEGFTILRKATNSNGVQYYEVSYSNSTTTGGTGYVKAEGNYYVVSTSAGIVSSSTTVYYGTNTSQYGSSGSVSAGETVCILAAKNSWYYIEYNTSSGRKRGWCAQSAIDCITNKQFKSTPEGTTFIGDSETVGNYIVYSGPGSNYAQIGQVGNESVYVIFRQRRLSNVWDCAAYSTSSSNKLKVGWIYRTNI